MIKTFVALCLLVLFAFQLYDYGYEQGRKVARVETEYVPLILSRDAKNFLVIEYPNKSDTDVRFMGIGIIPRPCIASVSEQSTICQQPDGTVLVSNWTLRAPEPEAKMISMTPGVPPPCPPIIPSNQSTSCTRPDGSILLLEADQYKNAYVTK